MKKRIIPLFLLLLLFSMPVAAEECEHQWSAWIVDEEPECFEPGQKSRYCYNCSAAEYAEIDPIGSHAWGPWVVDEVATCNNDGSKTRECSRCWDVETVTIPAYKEHTYIFTDWEIDVRPTALKKGRLYQYCDCFNKIRYKSVPKLKAKVSLKKKSISLKKKKSYTLKIKSKTFGDKILKWKTSKKSVATVNSKGVVTGKKKGTAVITLCMKSGAKASCTVKVK